MLSLIALPLLLALGPTPEQTAFLKAVSTGDTASVEQLLKNDPALIRCPSKTGATPVQRAVYYKQPKVLAVLMKFKPELDMGSACTVGDLQTVKTLEAKDPASTGRLSSDGFTPLCLAVAFDHTDVVIELLSHGAAINAHSRSIEHVAPLNSAVFTRNATMVSFLLDRHADPNIMEDGRWTPLDEAASSGDAKIVRILLDHGADPALKDAAGKTAKDYALKNKHPDVASLLKG